MRRSATARVAPADSRRGKSSTAPEKFAQPRESPQQWAEFPDIRRWLSRGWLQLNGSHLANCAGAMFQRILVPTDLTERAAKALDVAVTLNGADRPRVTLLHVIETFRGLDFDEMRPAYQKIERKARGVMAAAVEHLRSGGSVVSQEIVYGDRAEEIVKFATAQNIDLIVLASHKVKPSAVGRDWGTISYKVGLLAQCPVLLVK
jgi:universal stress protein A